jgi:formylglycine-generating enzyme required for sulfatase activity
LRIRWFLGLAAALVLTVAWGGAAHAVTIDWVTVGGAGNLADTEIMTCCGVSVGTTGYEFLNAVAATDTYNLYNTNMGSGLGGITRSGSSGSYTYSTIAGRQDMAVNFVSWFDSLRFANWMHNGQPLGAQDSTTTEDGSYTFIDEFTVNPRNASATIVLTSEDEWYKAAYYDALSTSYFDYPAGSDTQTTCAAPGATANTANCNFVVGDLTDVGSYTGSASPNGTFDQGGNVWEWNEAIVNGLGIRGLRGGSGSNSPDTLAASYRESDFTTSENPNVGFRLALVPEPGTDLLLMTGLLGLATWRRRRAR